MKRLKLGELLVQNGVIEQSVLNKAIELQRASGERLGRVLLNMGALDEQQLLDFLSRQLDLPFVDLTYYEVKPMLVNLLPETYARRYHAIVLAQEETFLLVGMADPLDIHAMDAITKIIKQPIHVAIVSENALLIVLDRVYRRTQEISHFAQELSGDIIEESTHIDDLFNESDDDERAPVVKLLNSLFRDAVQARASDIHIEPGEDVLRIRLRIDGVLVENILDDRRIVRPLTQRLKLRAHLDISEKRLPQDGRFNFTVNNHTFDVRLSTVPTTHGESVVMRLLDQSTPLIDLSQLGIPPDLVSRIEAIYSKPYGMLLLTGPTGSGKTTTLYSILARLNTPEAKIMTVEDPVEYQIDRVNQIQVNPKIELSFARVLRSILRQDPDVIMVGEIRDSETARIAMRAAVTGHLVLATLHTNDAMSSAMRLIDMGVEGYMVAAAVKAIMGQRLVRLLCKVCIKDHAPDDAQKVWLQSMGIDTNARFKMALGCSHCNYRGYHGRKGVYELLEINPEMLDALRLNNASRFAKAALACKTYRPLAEGVVDLLVNGETSVDEAIRVVGQLDEEFKHRDFDAESVQD